MKFCMQLSPYLPDASYGGKRLFDDMMEHAALCDRLGYESVSLTEHHLINILLMPAPLQFAVRIADATEHLKIMIAVSVLPIHDMRVFAGEVVVADILAEGRLLLGVSRGAFPFEMERLGVPIECSRARFDESLAVLMALLSREEVSWQGRYYRFDPLTIMPRPIRQPMPLMMAAATPESIFQCAKHGFHVQTTPLAGGRRHVLEQINAFHRGKEALGHAGSHLTLSLSRIGLLTRNEAHKQRALQAAHHYYSQFDNVFTGPGIVERGFIAALPREQTIEELGENLLIGSSQEIADKLSLYAENGVDRFVLNPNFGASQSEMLDTIQRFAEEVAPLFEDERGDAGPPGVSA